MSIKFLRKPTVAYAKEKLIANLKPKKSDLLSKASRTCKKIFQISWIIMKAVLWLFFGLSKRKFPKLWAAFQYGGLRLCWHRAIERFSKLNTQYDLFYNQLSFRQSEFLLSKFDKKPLISIIITVHEENIKWLGKSLKSVINQYYTNWEAVIVDVSGNSEIEKLLCTFTSEDSRIHTYFLKDHQSTATAANFGIKQAHGDFIGFLDCNNALAHDALVWLTWALIKNHDALWLYSDEDMISHNGRCHSPIFKPDFSPEFLLSNIYACYFSIYSAGILDEVGGVREKLEGAQYYDLALRLSEIVRKKKIIHVPRVLHHRRIIPHQTTKNIDAESKVYKNAQKAVEEALKNRNLKGKVTSCKLYPGINRIKLEPSILPKVSIIIPTKNAFSLLKKCLISVREKTKYQNFEILIIDHLSDDPAILDFFDIEKKKEKFRIIKYEKPYNHSDMNNIAIESVDSEMIVFMNNDIEILSDNWLEQLIATIDMDESIASVGCMLLYEDHTVQHAGIIFGISNVAGHAHKYMDSNASGYFGRLQALQEYSGVTAALSVMRRSAFIDVGGFNSRRYPTSFNDVDLCIRLQQRGYRCIYNPMVRAIHHESKTRPITKDEYVFRQRLAEDHREILLSDSFYNPNLTLHNEQFKGFRPFPVEEQIPELANMP